MMLGTVIIHIYWVFLYTTFQRMQLYGQNGHVSIVDIEEILLFKVVGLCSVPASKTSNTCNWTNRGKMANKCN